MVKFNNSWWNFICITNLIFLLFSAEEPLVDPVGPTGQYMNITVNSEFLRKTVGYKTYILYSCNDKS